MINAVVVAVAVVIASLILTASIFCYPKPVSKYDKVICLLIPLIVGLIVGLIVVNVLELVVLHEQLYLLKNILEAIK